MLKLFLCILFFPTLCFSANKQHEVFQKVSSNSRSELNTSREFHTVLQNLRRNRLNTSSTQSLLRLSNKSVGFKEYTPLINIAHEIAKDQNKYNSFFVYCGSSFQKINRENVATIGKRLFDDIQSFCRGLFLSHIKQIKRQPFALTTEEMDYLSQSINYFVDSEHLSAFTDFLKRIPKESEQYYQVSDLISKTSISLKVTPPQVILSQIHIGPELTSHIQNNGLFDQDASDFFKTEFRKMSNDLTVLIRTENFVEVDKVLQYSKVFYEENKKYVAQQMAWTTFGLSGRRLLYQKKFDLAKKSFEYALEMADDTQIDESRFYFLWVDIIQEDFKTALKEIERLDLLTPNSSHSSKLRFWMARILEKNGRKKQSLDLYQNITKTDPLSFYSILALKELAKTQPAQISLQIISQMRAPSAHLDFTELVASEEFTSSLQRLSLWLDLNLDSYSYFEINEILSSAPEKLFINTPLDIDKIAFEKFLVSQLSHFFNKKSKYLHTFRLVHNALAKDYFELNSEIIESLYPMTYFEDIKKIAPNVDPLVIMSLIRQESAFNESAQSVAGARGLMQLMPATARQLQKDLRIPQLNEPKLNIRLGTRYYSRLLKNYNGDLIDTLAAYNAGQGNLRNWKESVFVFGEEDPLVKIEMIPFKETRKYVKLIYRNMFYYRLLTNDPMIGESLAETLKVELN